MKIFIGSSSEAVSTMEQVSLWIEDYGYTPIPWNKPGLFAPGVNTMETLIQISSSVDAAIFIFSEDDKIWYRKDALFQPRDNVLLEYGLFVGNLGITKSIILKDGRPKEASDIRGINYINVSEKRRVRAKIELNIWFKNMMISTADTNLLKMEGKIHSLKKRNEEIVQELI